MKDKKNFIPETEFNEDDATTLRNAQIMSADSVDEVWDDSIESADAEDEDENEVLEITIESADGNKVYGYSCDSFQNAAGKTVKAVTKKEKKAEKKAAKKEKKAARKADRKEAKAERKEERKKMTFGQKLWRGMKVMNLAPVRAAFMSLAAINIFGIASHLKGIKEQGEKGNADAKKKYEKVKEFWFKMGGDRHKFDNVVVKGGARKPFLAKVKKKKGADGSEETVYLFGVDDNYQEWQNVAGVDDAAIAAWVGLATSVIVAVKKIAGKPKEMDTESEASLEQEASENEEEFNKGVAAESESETPEALRDVGNTPGIPEAFKKVMTATPKWVLFAIGGAVLIGGFFLVRSLIKKK